MTLTTNDAYAKGALVLGSSLKQHRTTRRLAVLTTPRTQVVCGCKRPRHLEMVAGTMLVTQSSARVGSEACVGARTQRSHDCFHGHVPRFRRP